MVRKLKMVKHLVLPFDQKAQSWVSWRQLWNELQRQTNSHTLDNAFENDASTKIIHSSPVCPGLEIGNVWTWFSSSVALKTFNLQLLHRISIYPRSL